MLVTGLRYWLDASGSGMFCYHKPEQRPDRVIGVLANLLSCNVGR